MTVKEFNKMRQDIDKEYREKIEHNWKLWEQKESDISKYNDLMRHETKDISYSFEYENIESVKNILKEAEEYNEENKWKPKFYIRVETEVSSSYDSPSLDKNCFVATWQEPRDFNESDIKSKIRSEVSNKLKPESATYVKTVDCKMLQMFREGIIDWKALQKLTYTDCEL